MLDTINNILAQLIAWLNVPMNAVGSFLGPMMESLPGWLSNTIISAFIGVIAMFFVKYTSNQEGIGRVRDAIKANMLILKLYKDEISVTMKAIGCVFPQAFLVMFYWIRPVLFMTVPVMLIMAQMSLWYQARPLKPGETAVVTISLDDADSLAGVSIANLLGAEVIVGPVRIISENEVSWTIRAGQPGQHEIIFRVGDQQIEKSLTVGSGLIAVSGIRPGWTWHKILEYPAEKPLPADSGVKAISISYPDRQSYTHGTNWWVGFLFLASIVAGLLVKPFFKVRI